MNSFKKTIATGAATAAMLTQLALPAFATTTIEISGNGSDTDNDAQVTVTQTTTVVQDNQSDIDNTVSVDATTGDNTANDNTGGDTAIDTGDADVTVQLVNETNTNVADVNGCNCDQDAEVLISGNGSDSDNDVDLDLMNNTQIFQNNNADVDNTVDVDADTGNNKASGNTGGDVEVKTGRAVVDTRTYTTANTNVARNGTVGNGGTIISARILGNGESTKNTIDLDHMRTVLLDQDNTADVKNDVEVDAETGENKANDNTDGEVIIDTGDTDVVAIVDNLLNFNAAELDCGCMLNVMAKVADNGSESDNMLAAAFVDDLQNFQNNNDKTDNDVDVDGDTGNNEAEDNTLGSDMGDPRITTGDADADVKVYNSNNVNQLGDVDMNGYDMGTSVSISFDLNALLSMLLGL